MEDKQAEVNNPSSTSLACSLSTNQVTAKQAPVGKKQKGKKKIHNKKEINLRHTEEFVLGLKRLYVVCALGGRLLQSGRGNKSS